jgi:hypothetical protein
MTPSDHHLPSYCHISFLFPHDSIGFPRFREPPIPSRSLSLPPVSLPSHAVLPLNHPPLIHCFHVHQQSPRLAPLQHSGKRWPPGAPLLPWHLLTGGGKNDTPTIRNDSRNDDVAIGRGKREAGCCQYSVDIAAPDMILVRYLVNKYTILIPFLLLDYNIFMFDDNPNFMCM